MKNFLDKVLDIMMPVILLMILLIEILLVEDYLISSALTNLLISVTLWILFIKLTRFILKNKIKVESFNIVFSIINTVAFITLMGALNPYVVVIYLMSVTTVIIYIYDTQLKPLNKKPNE